MATRKYLSRYGKNLLKKKKRKKLEKQIESKKASIDKIVINIE